MTPHANTSPHINVSQSVTEIMLLVLIALVPGCFALFYFFGPGVLFNIVLANLTAILCESIMLKLRNRPVLFNVSDASAVVTATLLAMCLPPICPWWVTVIASGFAIVVGKQLYGGLGQNLFNPAMIGYVVVLISFPGPMSHWISPHTNAAHPAKKMIQSQMAGDPKSTAKQFDSITSATPLDTLKNEIDQGKTINEIKQNPLFGAVAGVGWEWINFAFLIGGLFLLYKKVIPWHTPIAMLGSLVLLSGIFYSYDSDIFASPLFHLFSGGTMLAAFFIATDPVTTCASNTGRLIFGCGVAIYTFVIRTWGGYPDGLAFAVLLMNLKVPAIDYFIKPKAYGHKQ